MKIIFIWLKLYIMVFLWYVFCRHKFLWNSEKYESYGEKYQVVFMQ